MASCVTTNLLLNPSHGQALHKRGHLEFRSRSGTLSGLFLSLAKPSHRQYGLGTSRSRIAFVSSCQHPPAGIPVAINLTTVGSGLLHCLEDKPEEFATLALQAAWETSENILHGSLDGNRVATARHQAVVEDIVYAWALAEAYCLNSSMQERMRQMLGRHGDGWLAQGTDGKQMVSSTYLLPGQDGLYLIGSVRFQQLQGTSTSKEDKNVPSTTLKRGVWWGGSHSAAARIDSNSDSSSSGRSGSGNGAFPLLVDYDSKRPSRMNRFGAARTYHMYADWGYFNRRMHLHRQGQPASAGAGVYTWDAGERESYYGSISKVWRYFENVPDELADMRSTAAPAVIHRHIRALFGDQDECITTLGAWSDMCDEARWFGRAVYDAEDFLLQQTDKGIHHLL